MIPGFYSKVMALPTARKASVPLKKKKAPAAKKKGKAVKAKKIKGGESNPFNVFKVVFESDAGGEPSHQQDQFFEEHLSELSESQLHKLKKKMEKILRKYLEGSTEHHEMGKAQTFIRDAVDRRLEKSRRHILELRAMLFQQLKKMKGLQGVYKKGNVEGIFYKEEYYTLRRFSQDFCAPIIDRYNTLLAAQKIIPRRQKEQGGGFVRREIRAYLNENGL